MAAMTEAKRTTIGGWLGLSGAQGKLRLARGVLTTANHRIETVRELPGDAAMPTVDYGGEGSVILPGFVDTHLHLPQWDSIGAEGLTLLDWLDRVIFPAEARWQDPDFAGDMATRAAAELRSFGTTAIAAYGTVHHAGTTAAMRAGAEAGLRAAVGQVMMDRGAPGELVRPAKQLLEEARAMQSIDWPGRVEHAVSPRFAISCTPELLAGAGKLLQESGAIVQTHISEMQPECERVREMFGGARYAEVYRDTGLLGPRSVLGHGVWLDDVERTILRDANAVIAHCPSANLFLDSGMLDLEATKAAGVRVSLGSDVAAGSDRSMPRVARWMIETARARGAATPPTADQAWWTITAGNADALGWRDSGRLTPGAWADLVIATPTRAWSEGTDRALAHLLYAWDERWIDHVMLAGDA